MNQSTESIVKNYIENIKFWEPKLDLNDTTDGDTFPEDMTISDSTNRNKFKYRHYPTPLPAQSLQTTTNAAILPLIATGNAEKFLHTSKRAYCTHSLGPLTQDRTNPLLFEMTIPQMDILSHLWLQITFKSIHLDTDSIFNDRKLLPLGIWSVIRTYRMMQNDVIRLELTGLQLYLLSNRQRQFDTSGFIPLPILPYSCNIPYVSSSIQIEFEPVDLWKQYVPVIQRSTDLVNELCQLIVCYNDTATIPEASAIVLLTYLDSPERDKLMLFGYRQLLYLYPTYGAFKSSSNFSRFNITTEHIPHYGMSVVLQNNKTKQYVRYNEDDDPIESMCLVEFDGPSVELPWTNTPRRVNNQDLLIHRFDPIQSSLNKPNLILPKDYALRDVALNDVKAIVDFEKSVKMAGLISGVSAACLLFLEIRWKPWCQNDDFTVHLIGESAKFVYYDRGMVLSSSPKCCLNFLNQVHETLNPNGNNGNDGNNGNEGNEGKMEMKERVESGLNEPVQSTTLKETSIFTIEKYRAKSLNDNKFEVILSSSSNQVNKIMTRAWLEFEPTEDLERELTQSRHGLYSFLKSCEISDGTNINRQFSGLGLSASQQLMKQNQSPVSKTIWRSPIPIIPLSGLLTYFQCQRYTFAIYSYRATILTNRIFKEQTTLASDVINLILEYAECFALPTVNLVVEYATNDEFKKINFNRVLPFYNLPYFIFTKQPDTANSRFTLNLNHLTSQLIIIFCRGGNNRHNNSPLNPITFNKYVHPFTSAKFIANNTCLNNHTTPLELLYLDKTAFNLPFLSETNVYTITFETLFPHYLYPDALDLVGGTKWKQLPSSSINAQRVTSTELDITWNQEAFTRGIFDNDITIFVSAIETNFFKYSSGAVMKAFS